MTVPAEGCIIVVNSVDELTYAAINVTGGAAPVAGDPLTNPTSVGTGMEAPTYAWTDANGDPVTTAGSNANYTLTATLKAANGYALPETATNLAGSFGFDGEYVRESLTEGTITWKFGSTDVIIDKVEINAPEVLEVGKTIADCGTIEPVTGGVELEYQWYTTAATAGNEIGEGATVASGRTYILKVTAVTPVAGYTLADGWTIWVNGSNVDTVSYSPITYVADVNLSKYENGIKGGSASSAWTAGQPVSGTGIASTATVTGDPDNFYNSGNHVEGYTYTYIFTVTANAGYAFNSATEVNLHSDNTVSQIQVGTPVINSDGTLSFTVTFTATAP